MYRSTKPLLALAALAATLVLAACGGTSYGGGSTTKTTTAAPTGATVAAKSSPLGNLLVDAKGRTLYLFEADKGSASTCYSACASAWPPLLTKGAAKAGTSVTAAGLGTTKRKDGTSEVTYHGHPLYYYAGDSAPGATTGEGLDQFGAEWYVVAPSGKKIEGHGS